MDADQDVLAGAASSLNARDRKTDGYPGSGRRIRDGVITPTAIKQIIACTTDEGVIAVFAIKRVIARAPLKQVFVTVARKQVVENRTDNVAEVRLRQGSPGTYVLGSGVLKIDGDGVGRIFKADSIDPVTAIQRVLSASALYRVRAKAPQDQVCILIPDQAVAKIRTGQIFEPCRDVKLGTTGVLLGGHRQTDRHRRSGRRIGKCIDAKTAEQPVVAVTALQRVIAVTALQGVVAEAP